MSGLGTETLTWQDVLEPVEWFVLFSNTAALIHLSSWYGLQRRDYRHDYGEITGMVY
jgi:hypothetical protein